MNFVASFASKILLAALAPVVLVAPVAVHAQQPQTLSIEFLEVLQSGRTLQKVKVRVRNVTSEPQSGILWYVLASPTEPEPWRVHEYSSSERSISLRPGRVATVEFAGPDTPLDGKFALSVWLHGSETTSGQRFHSDMRGHNTPLVIAPTFSFSVDYLISPSGAEDTSATNVLVRFSVRNNQERNAQVGLDYRITPAGEKPEPDMGQLARTAEIAAGVDYIVTIRHHETLPPEPFELTGWIYELLDGQLYYRGKDVTPITLKD